MAEELKTTSGVGVTNFARFCEDGCSERGNGAALTSPDMVGDLFA